MRPPSPAVLRRLLRSRDRIHDAYAEPLPLETLATSAGLSRFYFHRAFTAAFGMPPHAYLTHVRLERAKEELARGRSVTEACLAVGFSSLGSFSALFSRRLGCSPAAWQRAVRRVVPVPARFGRLYVPACFAAWYAPGNFGEADPPAWR